MSSQIQEQIRKLKKEKNAIILAHYYVEDSVQEVADYLGDSYYLAKVAKETDSDIIVFCGVQFMGESAKILNPDKKVLLPEKNADCPMAHMSDIPKIIEMKETIPDLAVVCYINSAVDLKAVSDVIVTSSNAMKIINALPEKNILFVPDQNLGRFCEKQAPNKKFYFQDGHCHVHSGISAKDLAERKKEFPNAKVIAHPECREEVLSLADFVGSTSALLDYTDENPSKEFIVVTEIGILCEMKRRNPDKLYHLVSDSQVCGDMKKVTLESVLKALQEECYQVEVSPELTKKGLAPLEKMLELAK